MIKGETLTTVLLGVLFFLSGCAGLIYQNVWVRQLVGVYGNTTYAAGAVIAVFMGGLALGSFLGGRLARRMRVPSPSIYGWLEIVIALGGFMSLFMLPVHYKIAERWLGFIPMGFQAFLFKGITVLPFMIFPTMAMGATFPVFVRTWTHHLRSAGRRVALAYSINTLGAFSGTMATAFLFIPLVGLRKTILVAVVLNLVAGAGALILSRIMGYGFFRQQEERADPDEQGGPYRFQGVIPARAGMVGLVYFVSGFVAIMLEIVWVRILVLHLGSSVYAFALMLAMVLMGIGLGSFLIHRWLDRCGFTHWGLFYALTALSLVMQIYQFQGLGDRFVALARVIRPERFETFMGVLFAGTFQALILPTLMMGITFPLGIRLMARALPELGRFAGVFYGVNTMGAIFAAVVTPILFLPYLGVNTSLAIAIVLEWALAFFIILSFSEWKAVNRRSLSVLIIIFMGLTPFVLPETPVLLHAGIFTSSDRKVLAFEEGVNGTVTVSELHKGWLTYRLLEINGVNVAGTSPDLITIQKIQGHLPLLLHPHPERVLHIGFGSGGTAYAVSLHPVKTIDVVEIAPEVVEMANRHFRGVHHGVLEDPRVTFYWGDGRNYLITTDKTYDVILSDSIHPRYAGNGSLYTEEYFATAARRLNPQGVFSMWLPLYSLSLKNFQEILSAFYRVFPSVKIWYIHNTLNAYVVVTGRRERPWNLDIHDIERRFQRPLVLRDMTRIQYRRVMDLLDNLLVTSETIGPVLKQIPPHRDDRPTVEYESTRLLFRDTSWRDNFLWLLNYRRPLTDAYREVPESLHREVRSYEKATARILEGIRAFLQCDMNRAVEAFQKALEVLPEHKEPWEFARFRSMAYIRPDFCR